MSSVPTVEPDDALQVFDPQTRRLLDQGTPEDDASTRMHQRFQQAAAHSCQRADRGRSE